MENGLKKFSGQYVYADCKFHFSGRENPKGKSLAKLIVRLLSPETGKTLQIQGPQRRKIEARLTEQEKDDLKNGKQVAKLNAQTEIYLNTLDEHEIRKRIKEGAMRLYTANYPTLQKMLKRSVPTESMHTLAAYFAYQHDFFLTQHATTESTLKEKKAALEDICAQLDGYQISAITPKILRSVYCNIGGKEQWKFGIARKFFTYIEHEGVYSGPNPFDRFYEEYAADGKSPNREAARRAAKVHRIDAKNERLLHQRIQNQIGTPCALVIPLAKGARLTVEEIAALLWEDIRITDNDGSRKVLIRNFREQLTGGTHNFTRPPLPETTDFILQQYDFLRQKYSESALTKMYVVPDSHNPKKRVPEKTITAYIRSELIHSGISYKTLAEYSDGNSKKPGGAGITLLHENYDHVLADECGVDIHSGYGCFLRGKVIPNVTDDYYYSFIREDGAHALDGLVRRDGRFSPEPEPGDPITETIQDDGTVEETIHSGGPNKLTGCTGKIILPPGGRVRVKSSHGFQGDLQSRQPGGRPKEVKKSEY
jgi:hypothetical protein